MSVFCLSYGQNSLDIEATFDLPTKSIQIKQRIKYQNTSSDTLSEIYLNDWSNSYSTKTTPLAQRFNEEFDAKFHFAKSRDRGFSLVTSIVSDTTALQYNHLPEHPDVLKVQPIKPIGPGDTYEIELFYSVVMPNSTFTDYGINDDQDIYLKYWYITPAVYDGKWNYYSNKNTEDLYIPAADIRMQITYPRNYALVSELNTVDLELGKSEQTTVLSGNNRVATTLILKKFSDFKFVQTQDFTVLTNIKESEVENHEKAIIIDRITNFISRKMGPYPHELMLITETDYKKDPLYGLNQLPEFLRPFSDSFQYELKILKTALKRYLDNVLITNPREDYWLSDGLQIYYLMQYVEEFYPEKKLLGSLANVWGVRSFHASDLAFNDRYSIFYMEMARNNRDQPLNLPKDQLIKFNANIAGKYKSAVGLVYLNDFLKDDVLDKSIREFLEQERLQVTKTSTFEDILKQNTSKDVNWFFQDFLQTRKKIDFKIKSLEKKQDSFVVTIKNKRDNEMPVSLFKLKGDSIVSKQWVEKIEETKTLTLPTDGADRLVLNYDQTIPEFNLRDNYKTARKTIFGNKPLQFRLFKDFEDPNYNQIFVMPLVEFNNIYDGLTLGAKFYNKTVLRKGFNYKFSPQYATRSQSFTGGGSVYYTQNIEDRNLYSINYGFGGKYNSIAEDAYVTVLTPSLSFSFRDDKDFRSNKFEYINARFLSIKRTIGPDATIEIDEPDYSVLNFRYINSDNNLVDYSRWYTDLQFAQKFGKLSLNYEYRKLTESNRQFNFRFFAGAFLYNKTELNSDYFSFALDRPTDYLFDYNYLGRAEDSGLFSQQIIIAEGGFKSMLPTQFANQWMTTINGGFSLWRYLELYGDLGLVKNKFSDANFVYDSGVRLNLVQDYFEVFFPVYSSLGWEIAQPNYDQRIRFKITVDPQVLLGLFRRRWY